LAFINKMECTNYSTVENISQIILGLSLSKHFADICKIIFEEEIESKDIIRDNFAIMESNFQELEEFHSRNCLSSFIRYYQKEYIAEHSTIYSPVQAICQSSGYGKTRLIFELAKAELFFVYYMCSSPLKTDSVPRRSPFIVDFVENISTIEKWSCLFIAMCIYPMTLKKKLMSSGEESTNATSSSSVPAATSFTTFDFTVSLFFKEQTKNPFSEVVELSKVIYQKFCEVTMPASKSEEDEELYLRRVLRLIYQKVCEDKEAEKPTTLENIINNITGNEWDNFSSVSKWFKQKAEYLQGDQFLLFVIDEANHLFLKDDSATESFQNFRRALRAIDQTIFPTMAILLGTNSKISNFAPPRHRESSKRLTSKRFDLIPPFFMFPMRTGVEIKGNFDNEPLLETNDVAFKFGEGDVVVTVQCISRVMELLTRSRAVFAHDKTRIILSKNNDDPNASLLNEFYRIGIDFAISKLVGFDREILSDQNTTNILLYVLAGCRYYLTSTTHLLNEQIVAQHMATCIGLSVDRSFVYAAYPSEPILAEASIQLTLRDNFFEKMIRNLCYFISSGQLLTNCGKGEIGELVCSILISRSYNLASFHLSRSPNVFPPALLESPNLTMKDRVEHVYTRPVPVIQFLRFLYCKYENFNQTITEIFNQYNNLSDSWANNFIYGVVHFSHFVKIDYTPTKEDLRQFIQQSTAICCKQSEKAYDFIIPIAIPSEYSKPISIHIPVTYHVGAILVQAKNEGSAVSVTEIVRKINKTDLTKEIVKDGKSFLLYCVMNVGEGGQTYLKSTSSPQFQTSIKFKRAAGFSNETQATIPTQMNVNEEEAESTFDADDDAEAEADADAAVASTTGKRPHESNAGPMTTRNKAIMFERLIMVFTKCGVGNFSEDWNKFPIADPVVDWLKTIVQFDRPYYPNLNENTYQGFTENVRRDLVKSVFFLE
jgi:hypothetical protein